MNEATMREVYSLYHMTDEYRRNRSWKWQPPYTDDKAQKGLQLWGEMDRKLTICTDYASAFAALRERIEAIA